ncbi:MAG TPA: hypothetical protein VFX76_14465 [Roseiflexaceae bacterium]|nr:hypothetical protein [Roseiflexaceae bacterium]
MTIELPEDLTIELKDRDIPDELVHQIAVDAIKHWLHSQAEVAHDSEHEGGPASPFTKSAIPFVDTLIDENRSLFDRLARFPYDE